MKNDEIINLNDQNKTILMNWKSCYPLFCWNVLSTWGYIGWKKFIGKFLVWWKTPAKKYPFERAKWTNLDKLLPATTTKEQLCVTNTFLCVLYLVLISTFRSMHKCFFVLVHSLTYAMAHGKEYFENTYPLYWQQKKQTTDNVLAH